MKNFQYSIFYDYQIILLSSNFYRKYDALFSALDLTGFPDINTDVGRTAYSSRSGTLLRSYPALCNRRAKRRSLKISMVPNATYKIHHFKHTLFL